MKYRPLLLVALLFIVLCVPMVSAVPPTSYTSGFTPLFNKTYDNVIYNDTYRWNDNATTPYQNLYFYVIAAIVLAIVGYQMRCEFCTILAIIVSSMGMYASYAVEFTYYGVTATVNVESSPDVYNYVAMTMHEITPMPNMMILMAVVCIMSVLNLYRIYLIYKAQNMESERASAPLKYNQ